MQSFGIRVFDFENETAGVSPQITGRGQAGKKLRAVAAVLLTLAAGVP